MPRAVTLSKSELVRAVTTLLRSRGFNTIEASAIAGFAVRASEEGYIEHGVGALYALDQLGELRPGTKHPFVRFNGPASIEVRAEGHLGYLPARLAVDALLERLSGGAAPATAVVQSRGFRGRLGHLVQPIASSGAVAFAVQSTPWLVPARKGEKGAVGTNPMAIGIPMSRRWPLVADISTPGPSFLHYFFPGRDLERRPCKAPKLPAAFDHGRLVLALAVQAMTAALADAPATGVAWPLVIIAVPCRALSVNDSLYQSWMTSLGFEVHPGAHARARRVESRRTGITIPRRLWDWMVESQERPVRATSPAR